MEVSDLGSIERFVDLDLENASAWSPPPETYPEKHRPARQAAAAATNLSRTSDPGKQPPGSHTPTHARMA